MVNGRSRASRGPGIGRAPEVARERRRVGDIGLPAAVVPAGAARAVERQRHVAELAGHVVAAAQHLAVHHDADADAIGDADEHEVAVRLSGGLAERPHLRQRAGAARVLDLDAEAGGGGQRLAQIHVAPAERRRMQHAHAGVLDHAGHDDADALAAARFAVLGQQRLDAARPGPRPGPSGSRTVGSEMTPLSGLPIRSASIRKVSLARMSTDTTERRRALM